MFDVQCWMFNYSLIRGVRAIRMLKKATGKVKGFLDFAKAVSRGIPLATALQNILTHCQLLPWRGGS
jgi:hypothetical protein